MKRQLEYSDASVITQESRKSVVQDSTTQNHLPLNMNTIKAQQENELETYKKRQNFLKLEKSLEQFQKRKIEVAEQGSQSRRNTTTICNTNIFYH